ncbi:MAG: hypothetical protein MUF04_14605 [Akkermansiaceae bacterium]|jgi:hypothetical protein|nr:hypothetical protein [Akkermansiaceae bacterium]
MKTNASTRDLDDQDPHLISHLHRPLVAAVLVVLILLATARSSPGQAPPAGDYGDAPDGAGALTHYPPMFHTTRPDARFPTEFHVIGTDLDPTDGWGLDWNTAAFPDAACQLTVLMTDATGKEGDDRKRVFVQTTPTLGPDAEWSVIATNPPATPEGRIEVPVAIDGPVRFFRLRFSEE